METDLGMGQKEKMEMRNKARAALQEKRQSRGLKMHTDLDDSAEEQDFQTRSVQSRDVQTKSVQKTNMNKLKKKKKSCSRNGVKYLTPINGDLEVCGKATIRCDLDVKGDAAIKGDLDVKGDATIKGDLDVKGNLSLQGDLDLQGTVNFKGDATIDGLLTSNYFKHTDSLTQPFPDGPYAVDHFQIAKDNVQLRSPAKYRVSDVISLQVSPVQTMTVDGVEYFGRMENDLPVYLTYPLPVTTDVYVPSIRQDRDTTFDFFPDEGEGQRYSGHLSLEAQLLANATSFYKDGALEQDGGTLLERNMNYIPDTNSLANLVLNIDISLWTGLIGIFLLDDLTTDAYDRLVQLQQSLAVSLTNGKALRAYRLLMKIAGSYGVPVDGPSQNSVKAEDRQRAIDLVIQSSNFQRLKHFKAWAQRHAGTETKDSSDQYQPEYDFSNISLINGIKSRVVIMGDPGSVYFYDGFASKLASWGISAVIYSATYRSENPRTPGKYRSITEILNSGQSFPDSTFLNTNNFGYSVFGNYAFQSNPKYYLSQLIFSAGFTYDPKSSETGTSSYEFNQDTIQTVLDMLRNAVDVNGLSLSDKLRLTNQFGVFGRSGGSNALNGAHMINKEKPGTFRVGVAQDIVLTLPYFALNGGDNEDSNGNTGNMFDVASVFPGGLNFFVMFLEPKIDWYYRFLDGSNSSRYVVGSRKNLQNLFRRTIMTYRSRSMFMEYAPTGHEDTSPFLWSNETGYQGISGKGIRIADKPTFPDIHKDPVYGIQDTTNNRGNIVYAMLNTFTLYLRSALSQYENISAAMFDFMPFKYEFAPWDIPGADDYQWPYNFWQMDLGGDFRVRTDIVPSFTEIFNGTLADGEVDFVKFEITDPTIEVLQVKANYSGVGEITGDMDIYLYNTNGDVVTGAVTYSNPEVFYFDLREYSDAKKLGTWTVEIDGFTFTNNYTLTVIQGTWKLVFDSELHPNSATKPEFSLNRKTINIKNVPVSEFGLISGDVWSDSGFLKIMP